MKNREPKLEQINMLCDTLTQMCEPRYLPFVNVMRDFLCANVGVIDDTDIELLCICLNIVAAFEPPVKDTLASMLDTILSQQGSAHVEIHPGDCLGMAGQTNVN